MNVIVQPQCRRLYLITSVDVVAAMNNYTLLKSVVVFCSNIAHVCIKMPRNERPPVIRLYNEKYIILYLPRCPFCFTSFPRSFLMPLHFLTPFLPNQNSPPLTAQRPLLRPGNLGSAALHLLSVKNEQNAVTASE